jgi:hypothetical protein
MYQVNEDQGRQEAKRKEGATEKYFHEAYHGGCTSLLWYTNEIRLGFAAIQCAAIDSRSASVDPSLEDDVQPGDTTPSNQQTLTPCFPPHYKRADLQSTPAHRVSNSPLFPSHIPLRLQQESSAQPGTI